MGDMSIDLSPGFSVSVPFTFSDGPAPPVVDAATLATNFTNSVPSIAAFAYPDPTPGVANPARSVRIDVLPGAPTGSGNFSDISWRVTSPYDGVSVVNYTVHVNSIRGGSGPFAGGGSTGTPSAPFRTP